MADVNRIRGILGYAGYRFPIIALFVGFYLPLLAIFVFSFWERSGLWMEPAFSLKAYQTLFTTNLGQLGHSFGMGIAAGLVALIIAFPVAYLVTFVVSDFQRMVFLSIFAVPFFVSPFVRTLMWVPILGRNGTINQILLTLGVINEPIRYLLFSNTSVLIGALSAFMPFLIFTGWLSMEMLDRELINAASDLGGRPLTVTRTVIVPLALPGIMVGALFVMAASMGEAVFPLVLGGTDAVSIGLMTQRSFAQLSVPLASAITVVALIVYIAGLLILTHYVDLGELFTAFRK